MTTAINHPIHTWITQALKDGKRPYITNLENLIKHYSEYIQPDLEHITAYIRPPWWKLAATTAISTSNKEEAAQEHQQRLQQIPAQDLIIYTDRSGHGGQIGSAIYSPTINVTKGEYIGTDNTHNVYAAELTAIQMAITLFEEKIQEYPNVYVFTDNQSAIQTIEAPKQQSGNTSSNQPLIKSTKSMKPSQPAIFISNGYQDIKISREMNKQIRQQRPRPLPAPRPQKQE